MGKYPVSSIHNIAVLGHSGDGKTSLIESALFLTGATDRLGKIPDGNTVCDHDQEEIRRQITISAKVAPIELQNSKINFIDTPGYFDFEGESLAALRVSEAALIVNSAKGDIHVGTEKAWKRTAEFNMPRMLYISKIDEENSNFYHIFALLRDKYGVSVCPVIIPVLDGDKTVGLVNIITQKAYRADGSRCIETTIPESMADKVAEMRGLLSESVAETSDENMEKFFGGEEFTEKEFSDGIHSGMVSGSIVPVFCGSAYSGLGTQLLLDAIAQFAPSPVDLPAEKGDKDGAPVDISVKEDGAAIAFVFKTTADQYGRFSFFKVISGKVTSDMTLINARSGAHEKIGHLYTVRGKKNIEVKEISCGDIGAVSKLSDTKTCDTLCDAKSVVSLAPIAFPKPCYSLAISPKVKGAEEKIGAGLTKLHDEDVVFTSVQDPETHQLVLSGLGDIHIDVLCSKLKNKFGVEIEFSAPKVAYREKIRKKVKVEGKHKKQSGGAGQFGHVWIEFEPQEEQLDLMFEEKIFGGSVPKNYHPAVEKGLRNNLAHGILAGYPVVNLKATLVDGSYHDVDSNEISFVMAAALAFKAGLPLANPVIMEPVGSLKVLVPDSYMGDVIGDLNKRRGRIMGMSPAGNGEQEVEAEVPMGEMLSYAIDLRSMTQGRASFDLEFARYEPAPPDVQQKVIDGAKGE